MANIVNFQNRSVEEGNPQPSAPVQGLMGGRQIINSTENIRALLEHQLIEIDNIAIMDQFLSTIGAFALTAALVSSIFLAYIVSPAFLAMTFPAAIATVILMACACDSSNKDLITKAVLLGDKEFLEFAESRNITLNTSSFSKAVLKYKQEHN